MDSDVKGCSTVANGEEEYDIYYSSIAKGKRVQYDYRHTDGTLFSTVAKTLEVCRERRDAWLVKKIGAA